MAEIVTMTAEQQDAARRLRLAEQGTLPPCPFCGKPRVQRSDYIRCNPCGINWLAGESLDAHPKIERWTKLLESMKPLREPKPQRG